LGVAKQLYDTMNDADDQMCMIKLTIGGIIEGLESLQAFSVGEDSPVITALEDNLAWASEEIARMRS